MQREWDKPITLPYSMHSGVMILQRHFLVGTDEYWFMILAFMSEAKYQTSTSICFQKRVITFLIFVCICFSSDVLLFSEKLKIKQANIDRHCIGLGFEATRISTSAYIDMCTCIMKKYVGQKVRWREREEISIVFVFQMKKPASWHVPFALKVQIRKLNLNWNNTTLGPLKYVIRDTLGQACVKLATMCQFHQRYTYEISVRTSFFYVHVTRENNARTKNSYV